MVEYRLQKLLAERGLASRREAEQWIAAGRVQVNGEIVREMGCKVDPQQDAIAVDGKPLPRQPRLRYILLHKPVGYICSAKDERGKISVLRLLHGVEERLYPVGRLDFDTSGLLLLTNDGTLTHRLLHPSHQVAKTYLAELRGPASAGDLEKLRQGVELEDGITAPAEVKLKRRGKTSTELEITIREGRNRQIRRMCKAVGHPVLRLQRIRFGQLGLGGLKAGQWRDLSPQEVKKLQHNPYGQALKMEGRKPVSRSPRPARGK